MDSEKPFSAIVGIGPFTIQARTGPEGEPSGWVGFPGWGFLLSSFRIRLIMRADGCRLGMMALQSRVRNLMALVPAVLLMASCNFQPDIKPLIFATAPPQPFSAFAPTEGDLSQIPSQSAPAETLGVVEKEADLAGFPAALAWAAGVLAAAAATISGFTFLIQRQESRPPVVLLIILAIIFLILFGILMEGLFAAAEAVLALSAATAATALLSLTVAAITAFLVNFEVAFCVYVYRVAFAPAQEEVKLDLRPLNWGLRPYQEAAPHVASLRGALDPGNPRSHTIPLVHPSAQRGAKPC